jgi:probable rRNA maturation factor
MEIDVRATASGAPATVRVRRLLTRAARALKDVGSGFSLTPGVRFSLTPGVSVLFCSDARMRTLNRRWRGKDKSTDVLAFPAGRAANGFLGDIVISVPYASREARRRKEPAAREVDRLLVHGLLHLMGYDHETDDGEMDVLENRLRRRLGIAEAAK